MPAKFAAIPPDALTRIAKALSSGDCTGTAEALNAGCQCVSLDRHALLDQATRYRRGQFLRQHSDEAQNEGRLFAYVINLSQHWLADWGGLLHFVDSSGSVSETFLPRWNALSLFRVPTEHIVSTVEPWADEERYAITGWMLR